MILCNYSCEIWFVFIEYAVNNGKIYVNKLPLKLNVYDFMCFILLKCLNNILIFGRKEFKIKTYKFYVITGYYEFKS